jgi:hypothetical protein
MTIKRACLCEGLLILYTFYCSAWKECIHSSHDVSLKQTVMNELEDVCLLAHNSLRYVQNQPTFQENMSPLSSWLESKLSKESQ